MDRDTLRSLLRRVRSGKVGVEEAAERLRRQSVDEIGFAALDLQRALRRGFPEVVYGPGKTTRQVVEIVGRLRKAGQTVLVTRVDAAVHAAVARTHPEAEWLDTARMIRLDVRTRKGRRRSGIVVLSAGTSDVPVAEEAAVTAETMGNEVRRIYDVGVAGLHRLLAHKSSLMSARVIVAVAGMEGALPSVVAGLTDCPVIGVPTSIGYGAGAGGHAALLAMLNSCATGLTVVNIDNGFGAGFAAALVNRLRSQSTQKK